MTLAIDDRCFALNAPKVACQILDGEALLIHFERGHYYSAAGSAAFLLQLLEHGLDERDLSAALAERFDLETDRARRVVSSFVEQLLEDELFVVTAKPVPDESAASSGLQVAPGKSADAFEEPQLSKYTDLEDLLVLDPVHDVMMTGWPGHAATPSTSGRW